MSIDQKAFAFFRLLPMQKILTVEKSCTLPEKPGRVSTLVDQVLPITGYWHQATDGTVYLPILDNAILAFDPKKLNTGPVKNSKLVVLNMTEWSWPEWRALPTFLNLPQYANTETPLDFQIIYDQLFTKLENLVNGASK